MVFALMALYGIYLFAFLKPHQKDLRKDGSAGDATSSVPNTVSAPSEPDIASGSTSRVARMHVDDWLAAQTNYEAASKWLSGGRTNEAFAAFEAALTRNPLHVKARAELGRLQFETGDYAAAETNLLQALAADPAVLSREFDRRSADKILSLTYQNQGRYADARAIVEWMIQRDPASIDLHKMAAELCLNKLNLPAEAVPHLVFIAQQSENSAALNDLADAYVKLANYDKAMDALRRSLRLNQSDLNAYFTMVICQIRSGKSAEAIGTLEKATIQCQPDKVVPWAQATQELEGIRTNDAYRAWIKKYDGDKQPASGP